MSTIKVTFDYDDIDTITGFAFEDRLSADSIQALMEGFREKEVSLSELINTIHDAILNEDIDEVV